MPLFESRAKRNLRLFNDAFAFFAERVDTQSWDPEHQAMHIAWLAGGSQAAKYVVDQCDQVSRHWGKGSDELARKLTQVFSLPVIPRFVRWEPGMSDDDQELRRRLIGNGISDTLKMSAEPPLPTEITKTEYSKLQDQYEFELAAFENGEAPFFFIEMDYLLSRALTIVGQPTKFSLGAVVFPVPDVMEFLLQGGEMATSDLTTSAIMFDAVHLGLAVASTAFADIQQDEGD